MINICAPVLTAIAAVLYDEARMLRTRAEVLSDLADATLLLAADPEQETAACTK